MRKTAISLAERLEKERQLNEMDVRLAKLETPGKLSKEFLQLQKERIILYLSFN